MATLALPGPVIEGEYRELPREEPKQAKKAKTLAEQIAEERKRNEQREAELKERQQLRAEKQRRERLQFQLLSEKAAHATTPLKTTAQAAKPYVSQAYQELKPAVTKVAKGVVSTGGRYFRNIMGGQAPLTARFGLTPRGQAVARAYLQGDYSTIPQDSVRAHMLTAAHGKGFFTLGAAMSYYGSDAVIASEMLIEQGLTHRV